MTLFLKKFVFPVSVAQDDDTYLDNRLGLTYTDVNYRKGIAGYIKCIHFEAALQLTTKYFHSVNVIDYGCADGPFLPSLSKYFNNVVGMDPGERYIRQASRLVDRMNLSNVKLVTIKNIEYNEPKVPLEQPLYPDDPCDFKILFLLETLEHIGDINDLYTSQISFLKDLFKLLHPEGIIVISVPKMFGISYFFQYVSLKLLDQYQEQNTSSLRNLIKSTFWIGTETIEKRWNYGHTGYNYKKLERHLKQNFKIISQKDMVFQKMYVISNFNNNDKHR